MFCVDAVFRRSVMRERDFRRVTEGNSSEKPSHIQRMSMRRA